MRRKNEQRRRKRENKTTRSQKEFHEREKRTLDLLEFRKSSPLRNVVTLNVRNVHELTLRLEEKIRRNGICKYPNYVSASDLIPLASRQRAFLIHPGPVLLFICNGNNRPRRYIRTRRFANSRSGAISTSNCDGAIVRHTVSTWSDYIYIFSPPAIFAHPRNPRFSFSRDFRERESDELASLVRCFFLPHRRELFVNRRASIIRFLELRETYASSRACQPVVFQTGERASFRETVNQSSFSTKEFN